MKFTNQYIRQLLYLLFFILLFNAVSCTKCYECNRAINCEECIKSGSPTVVVCSKDFYYPEEFADEVSWLTGQGYSCADSSTSETEVYKTCSDGTPSESESNRSEAENRGFECSVN